MQLIWKPNIKTLGPIICFFVGITAHCQTAEEIQGSAALEKFYLQWRGAVEQNPMLTEPLLFQTNTAVAALNASVSQMRKRRYEMARYLCERFAAQNNISYYDAILLSRVAGIGLLFSGNTPTFSQNIGENLRSNFAEFKKRWLEGVYNDPSVAIGTVCGKLRQDESKRERVSAADLREIRRYGLFGVPALIAQVKETNSKQAFAALLVMLEDDEQYRAFLNDPNDKFPTAAEKLKVIAAAVGRLKAEQESAAAFWTKVSAALNN